MNILETMVIDFIRSANTILGCGYFRDIEVAVKLAQSLSKNSINKFFRYEIVPVKFFECLYELELLDAKQIPEHGIKLSAAMKIIEKAGFLEVLFPKNFKAIEPYKYSFSSQRLWQKIVEEVRFSRNASIPRSQRILYQSSYRR